MIKLFGWNVLFVRLDYNTVREWLWFRTSSPNSPLSVFSLICFYDKFVQMFCHFPIRMLHANIYHNNSTFFVLCVHCIDDLSVNNIVIMAHSKISQSQAKFISTTSGIALYLIKALSSCHMTQQQYQHIFPLNCISLLELKLHFAHCVVYRKYWIKEKLWITRDSLLWSNVQLFWSVVCDSFIWH